MPKCLILDCEITEEECANNTLESYKEKNGKELQKKFKRIMFWKTICKECRYHQKPSEKEKQ